MDELCKPLGYEYYTSRFNGDWEAIWIGRFQDTALWYIDLGEGYLNPYFNEDGN